MFLGFFRFITGLGIKYRFLKKNPVWNTLKPFYRTLRRYFFRMAHFPAKKPDESVISFFTQNTGRIHAISNLLADELSKKVYSGIIKFRQTGNKKDFPPCDYKTAQYFIKELQFNQDEIFIDCGAYVGDTIDDFITHNRHFKQIIAFEPDTESFRILQRLYGNNPKISLLNEGVYDKDGQISFAQWGKTFSSVIDDANGEQTNVVQINSKAIDNLNVEKVTFIKMDIEGAELKALKGAKKTIVRDKPKLAICIYHSNEDMLNIAEYIHETVPDYKLYIRHHCFYPYTIETVLYAQMP